MLYLYENKVYVKPSANQLVEVKIEKEKDGSYNVMATKNKVIKDYLEQYITSISVEEAFNFLNKRKREINKEV